MKKYEDKIIGILGGMGSYATLHFFEELLDKTPADKEWDRPRIIIDNRCTMPSRVRAIIYEEERPLLVKQLADSVKYLILGGATDIVLACNTSHVFLDEVYELVPEAKGKIVHIIDTLAKSMQKSGIKKAGFVATEGTIMSGIYEDYFNKYGITLSVPSEEDFTEMRYLIEAVKHNEITDDICDRFVSLLKKQAKNADTNTVILGCTEFPCIYSKAKQKADEAGLDVWDPLSETINEIIK